jgi:hypothetical protein
VQHLIRVTKRAFTTCMVVVEIVIEGLADKILRSLGEQALHALYGRVPTRQ